MVFHQKFSSNFHSSYNVVGQVADRKLFPLLDEVGAVELLVAALRVEDVVAVGHAGVVSPADPGEES